MGSRTATLETEQPYGLIVGSSITSELAQLADVDECVACLS